MFFFRVSLCERRYTCLFTVHLDIDEATQGMFCVFGRGFGTDGPGPPEHGPWYGTRLPISTKYNLRGFWYGTTFFIDRQLQTGYNFCSITPRLIPFC